MRPELLMHPTIPEPLHGMSPRALMGSEWWDATRKWVYRNAGYRCQCCGVEPRDALYHQWLEAHETYDYDYENCIATVNEIVALCHACHSYIHIGLLGTLATNGQIPYSKYEHIKARGDAILAHAGLARVAAPNVLPSWERWRIIIAGREYKTIWPTYQAWAAQYGV